MRDKFSEEFWRTHGNVDVADIIDVDETGVYFNASPRKSWSLRGDGNARTTAVQRHSARITVVVGARANGATILWVIVAVRVARI